MRFHIRPDMNFSAQRLAPAIIGVAGLLWIARDLPAGAFASSFAFIASLVWFGIAATGLYHYASGVAGISILVAALLEKTATDVIIRATARSFDRKPRSDWPVSVSILDRLRYEFQVRGPSQWQHRRLGGWTLSQPELVHEVPLSYALSYGGYVLNGDEDKVAYEFNPSGLGFATPESLKNSSAFSAPQIGLLGEFMSADPLTPMSVEGFGPIAKTWLPRRSEAGTFDADWQRDRHPRMPMDYNLSFWNAGA
ncbi:hypothetical protein GQR58_024341 [Nymphon striatum]|nr:hypothetical protein GQR58_024341 [Nymphon striatum]